VIHILLPLTTHSSPSFSAVVETEETSLPVSGSEMAEPMMASPSAMGGRYSSFWSSVPNATMASLPNAVPRTDPPTPGSAAYNSSMMMATSRAS